MGILSIGILVQVYYNAHIPKNTIKETNDMNKLRRKRIAEAIELMERAREILETVAEEEQEAFDNMPESLQSSERGETMEENIYAIEEVLDGLDTDGLEEIVYG